MSPVLSGARTYALIMNIMAMNEHASFRDR